MDLLKKFFSPQRRRERKEQNFSLFFVERTENKAHQPVEKNLNHLVLLIDTKFYYIIKKYALEVEPLVVLIWRRLSTKSKKPSTQRSLRLCGEPTIKISHD